MYVLRVGSVIPPTGPARTLSLHTGHAYGVPAAWVELSDKVAGKGFKFADYYSVFDREPDRVTAEEVLDGDYAHALWSPLAQDVERLGDRLEAVLRAHFMS